MIENQSQGHEIGIGVIDGDIEVHQAKLQNKEGEMITTIKTGKEKEAMKGKSRAFLTFLSMTSEILNNRMTATRVLTLKAKD